MAALAARQNGPFTLDQLVELGLTPQTVFKRARSGRYHRIHRAVYALVPARLLTLNGRRMAAVLACGGGRGLALLSHRDAAALHSLRQNNRPRFEVTVPGGSTRRHPGIQVHRSATLTAADGTVLDGIPCTTVARTLLDLAAVVPPEQLERALNQAEALQVFDLRALEDQLRRNPPHRGVGRLRRALGLYRTDAAPAESRLELALLALVRRAGLPEPERQVWIDCHDGEPPVRADFVWRERRLILETDGHEQHGTRRAFEADRRKDQRLTAAGWQVVRVTWRQIEHESARLVALLTRLLADRTA